jgi:hypothetical protein
MKKKQHLKATFGVMLLCTGASSAFAGDTSPFYLGLGVGSSTFDISSSYCTQQLQTAANSSAVQCKVQPTDSAAKIFGGYNITQNAAIEFTSVAFGNLVLNTSGPGGQLTVTDQTDALSLDLVGTSTPNPYHIFFSGRIGAYNATTNLSDPRGITNQTATNTGLDMGLGIGYEFSTHIRARLEFQRFRGVGTTTTVVSNPNLTTAVFVYNF